MSNIILRCTIAACTLLTINSYSYAEKPINVLDWPKVTAHETKPWTWWWWHRAAANKKDITLQLEQFSKAGFGGVNIVSLLGIVDPQAPVVDFLSDEHLELLRHAIDEARRLDMDIDMSPVSGWAFGSKHIQKKDACALVGVATLNLNDIRKEKNNVFYKYKNDNTINYETMQSALACSSDGQRILVTDKITPIGALQWKEPKSGDWTIYLTYIQKGSSLVRATSEDWNGYVVDHLNAESTKKYFDLFDKAFKDFPKSSMPRAFNNDSWEIELDWTDDMFDQFKKRRGYDLQNYMPEMLGYGNEDTIKRVVCDYRETMSDLMIEEFTPVFKNWAKKYGAKIIGEIQFEPGNEIDINSMYDIPQADMGGGLGNFIKEKDYKLQEFFTRCKFPGSPAHIMGKPYISSETYTCMNGLNGDLESVKIKTDVDFIAGVNHSCFHGITYSPSTAKWPGWLFYAGTQLGPFNPQWRQMPKLCDYITKCQSFLQMGRSNNDVLFYMPFHDQYSYRNAEVGVPPKKIDLSVNRFCTDDTPTAYNLYQAGMDFDYITDYMLANYISVKDNKFVSSANEYKTIVVGDCKFMPDYTLKRLYDYALQGGTVVFIGTLPKSVPGLANLDQRQKTFDDLIKKINEHKKKASSEVDVSKVGEGKFVFGNDVKSAMLYAGVLREKMYDMGLRYIRRSGDGETLYFITNYPTNKRIDGWVPVSCEGKSVAIFDPMSCKSGIGNIRCKNGISEVYLQLDPKQSCIIRVFDEKVDGEKWNYLKVNTLYDPIVIDGEWDVEFVAGGEEIPKPEKIKELKSWTEWVNSPQIDILKGFAGTARYKIKFKKPDMKCDNFMLDLGETYNTAKVTLNGKYLAEFISSPKTVTLDNLIKDGENILEIEITNAPINRANYMSYRGIDWGYLTPGGYEGRYGGYVLKEWTPEKSGLVGPVKIIAVDNL